MKEGKGDNFLKHSFVIQITNLNNAGSFQTQESDNQNIDQELEFQQLADRQGRGSEEVEEEEYEQMNDFNKNIHSNNVNEVFESPSRIKSYLSEKEIQKKEVPAISLTKIRNQGTFEQNHSSQDNTGNFGVQNSAQTFSLTSQYIQNQIRSEDFFEGKDSQEIKNSEISRRVPQGLKNSFHQLPQQQSHHPHHQQQQQQQQYQEQNSYRISNLNSANLIEDKEKSYSASLIQPKTQQNINVHPPQFLSHLNNQKEHLQTNIPYQNIQSPSHIMNQNQMNINNSKNFLEDILNEEKKEQIRKDDSKLSESFKSNFKLNEQRRQVMPDDTSFLNQGRGHQSQRQLSNDSRNNGYQSQEYQSIANIKDNFNSSAFSSNNSMNLQNNNISSSNISTQGQQFQSFSMNSKFMNNVSQIKEESNHENERSSSKNQFENSEKDHRLEESGKLEKIDLYSQPSFQRFTLGPQNYNQIPQVPYEQQEFQEDQKVDEEIKDTEFPQQSVYNVYSYQSEVHKRQTSDISDIFETDSIKAGYWKEKYEIVATKEKQYKKSIDDQRVMLQTLKSDIHKLEFLHRMEKFPQKNSSNTDQKDDEYTIQTWHLIIISLLSIFVGYFLKKITL